MKVKEQAKTIDAVQWNGFTTGPQNLGIIPLRPGEVVGWVDYAGDNGSDIHPGDYIITTKQAFRTKVEVISASTFNEHYVAV